MEYIHKTGSKVLVCEELVIWSKVQAESLHPIKVGIRGVSRESGWDAFESTVHIEDEPRVYLREYLPEVSPTYHDVFPDNFQHFRRTPDVAHRHHIAIALGAQVEIVAAVSGLLSSPVDIHSHVGFVGRLILGEALVPVDAVCAILRRKRADGVVKGADACKHITSKSFHLGFRFQVAVFVGIKPFLVVVPGEVRQELYGVFHTCKDKPIVGHNVTEMDFLALPCDKKSNSPLLAPGLQFLKATPPRSPGNREMPKTGTIKVFELCYR